MKNKQGNVAVIAIIIILVAIASGAFSWMFTKKSQTSQQVTATLPATATAAQQVQQPDETATWKTYIYTDLGLSLKYPQEKLGDNNLPGFANAIKFNKQADGLGDWTISEQNAKELLSTSSCDILKNKSEKEGAVNSNFYLPSLFDKPNLCGVIKGVDNVIFYAIGKDTGFEELPSIDSGLLVIEKDRAVVISGLLSDKVNADMQIWVDAYLKNNPGVEFPNSEFTKMLPLANNKIDELLQDPSATMNANLNLLQKIASSTTNTKK